MALAIGGGAYVYLTRSHDGEKKPIQAPPVTITTVTATTGDIGQYVDAIGTVTPIATDAITSQVNGMIKEIHYQEGQVVAVGDPLIDIDASPYLATLLQAQGSLRRDQGLLEQARMDADRYRDAWKRNAIAKQVLDDQEKLVQQDEGLVVLDQGMVQYDQIQVDFCHITAPIAGRVGLRLVDQGNVVQSSSTTALAIIAQLAPITIIFTIPEDTIGLVQAHLHGASMLAVDAFDRTGKERIDQGHLLTLDNQIDTTTGTVKARALFSNANGRLFPNEFVTIRLLVATLKGVTLLPTSAVQHNGQASYVYVIQEGVAHKRTVTAGITEAGSTQIDGIASGDVVANSAFEKLQDGAKIVLAGQADAQTPAKGDHP